MFFFLKGDIMKLSLVATLQVAVSVPILARVKRIDQENFESMMWKARQELELTGPKVDDEYVEKCILALKQYYVVALLDPNNFHAVSDILDPFWHAHILHTKQYVEFCQDVFGEYMHHRPLDHSKTVDVASVRRLYEYTQVVYEQIFTYYDRELFPKEVPDYRLCCCHGRPQNPDIRKHALFSNDPSLVLVG